MPDPLSPSSSVRAFAPPANAARSTSDTAQAPPGSAADAPRTAAHADNQKANRAVGDNRSGATGKRQLTEEEQRQVEELQRIDREVRRHEAAHQAAAGGLARGKSFSYQQGPDGKQYVVAGEVQIDMAPVPNDPRATIAKMQRVRAAALAPADPSPQDRAVASQAGRTEAQARAELTELSDTTSGEQNTPADSASGTDTSATGRQFPSRDGATRRGDTAAFGRAFPPPPGTFIDARA